MQSIVTTTAGAKRLRKQRASESVEIRAVRQSASAIHSGASAIRSSSILEQVGRRFQVSAGKLILVEGGPQLLSAFYAEHALDEQFLTLVPYAR